MPVHKHKTEGAVGEASDTSPKWVARWWWWVVVVGVLFFTISLFGGDDNPEPEGNGNGAGLAQAGGTLEGGTSGVLDRSSRLRSTGPRSYRQKMEVDLSSGQTVLRYQALGEGNAFAPPTFVMEGKVVHSDDPLLTDLREFAAPWKPGETSRELITDVLEDGREWPPKGFPGIKAPLPNGGVSYTNFGDGSGPDGHFYARVQGSERLYRMAGKGDTFPIAIPFWVSPSPDCKRVHIIVFRYTRDGRRHLAERYR